MARYARRAGIEGTLSQGVRTVGLRQARYRGLAKTQVQDMASATAINLGRLSNSLDGDRPIPSVVQPSLASRPPANNFANGISGME